MPGPMEKQSFWSGSTAPWLYSPNQIALATFLGAPLAGAVLMALNYRRLGHRPAAWKTALLGVAATALLIPLAMVLPSWFPGPALPVGCVVAMRQLAVWMEHNHLGGSETPTDTAATSTGMAVGVGLACLMGVFSAVVAVALVMPESKMVFGQAAIHYSDGASETDAHKVGTYLEQSGVTDERKFSVHLMRRSKTLLVKLVATGSVKDPATVASYQVLANKLSVEMFEGGPVEVHLCNEYLMVKKKMFSGGKVKR